jgi:hypothetical protein
VEERRVRSRETCQGGVLTVKMEGDHHGYTLESHALFIYSEPINCARHSCRCWGCSRQHKRQVDLERSFPKHIFNKKSKLLSNIHV